MSFVQKKELNEQETGSMAPLEEVMFDVIYVAGYTPREEGDGSKESETGKGGNNDRAPGRGGRTVDNNWWSKAAMRKFKPGNTIRRVVVQPMSNKFTMLMMHADLTGAMDLQTEADYFWVRKNHRLLNRVEKRDLEVEVLIGTMDYQRRIESDSEILSKRFKRMREI